MKVVVNSDILFQQNVMQELRRELRELGDGCREARASILFPSTALMEFDRNQLSLLDGECKQLRNAYWVLSRNGVSHDEPNPEDVVVAPDLVQLFEECGVEVEVVHPTMENFQEAHKRACLHLAPQPPDAQSDEMRDLVIWMIALDCAKAEADGAVLLSRDVVHTHERGDEEAKSVGLRRLRSVEDLLSYLHLQTPGGKKITDLLGSAWAKFESQGLQGWGAADIMRAEEPILRNGLNGLETVKSHLRVAVSGTQYTLTAQAERIDERSYSVELSEIQQAKDKVMLPSCKVVVDRPIEVRLDSITAKLDYLKTLMGEIQ